MFWPDYGVKMKYKRGLCHSIRYKPRCYSSPYETPAKGGILISLKFEPDVIEKHLARTAGDRHVALSSQTNRNPVNVAQIDALIGKG